jgi:XTP/dITP diphosphohydrolase
MPQLLIATSNSGKLKEIQKIFADLPFTIITPANLNFPDGFDVEETGDSFAANAKLKAEGFGNKAQVLTLAEDSGLVVDALEGRPGIYSKRYGANDQERIEKLLAELVTVPASDRAARFICSAYLYDPIKKSYFTSDGKVEGIIASEPRGETGFGYDPIFIPTEIHHNTLTFAELGPDVKNTLSHRARAVAGIKRFLIDLKA